MKDRPLRGPLRNIFAFSLTLLLTVFVVSFSTPQDADALSGSDFNPSRIIDDAVFYNKDAMSAVEIQKFLDSKQPNCDTNGSQPYTYRYNANPLRLNGWDGITPSATHPNDPYVTTTRAVYGERVFQRDGEWRGSRAPYTCLNEYTMNTNDIPPVSGLCKGYTGKDNESASEILYNIAQSCGINPQVMLVLLQKEQSLVTDDWPWGLQYKKATGVSCPDRYPSSWAPYNCDPDYLGFFKQMYYGAERFKIYQLNADGYNYRANRNNTILWHPTNTSCGTSNVFIENQATAALYIYTPYRPNQAALDNLYGSGDSCSSYGNRNFWRLFNDWFGPTLLANLPGCSEATNTTIACVWKLRNPLNDTKVFLSSNEERDELALSGMVYEGKAFFGNVAIAPRQWNIPVYRLVKPNGATFLTSDANERQVLSQLGFEDRGVDFYADPINANSGYPVYRLYNSENQAHAWTSSLKERNELVQAGYTSEGIAFSSVSTTRQERAPQPGKSLVYRFYMPNKKHFWTTDLYERDVMIKKGYKYEGVAWQSSRTSTTTPVYRLYSSVMKKHLYTTDAHEKDVLNATSSWTYEGISQYMSAEPTDKPVYRLYSNVTKNHLWTTSVNEKDTLVKNGTFRYEGVAWHQPQ